MPDWLSHRASVLAHHPAVITPEETVTYAELESRVARLASALLLGGVERGDRVALLAQNSLEFAVAAHAIPRAGAIFLPLNARLKPEEVARQLQHAGARVLLCHAPTRDAAREAASLAGLPAPLPLPFTRDVPLGDLVTSHDPSAVHSIMYTSGTTGAPRAAMLTFGNFWASAAGSAYNLGVQTGDRWLACMPLFHVGGLSILLRSAIYGTTAIIHPRFDEREVNRALREDGVTIVSVVSTMLQRMLDADGEDYPAALRVVMVGGGPAPEALLHRALERGLPVVQTYGLTEATSQVATLSPADALRKLGSAGKPLVTTELRVDAGAGEPGEILVRGATVTPGYFGDPEATARALRDGWFHTGDIGRLDDEGYLYVFDRRDDLIVTGGENVYPAEVEAVLMTHPAVIQAAVVGLPDERWGQVVAAAVVVREPVGSATIEAHVREQLAGFKAPRTFHFLRELPVTASGKVQRRLVREMLLTRTEPSTGDPPDR